jgi:tetratricopeptide (TPR) repeat protein
LVSDYDANVKIDTPHNKLDKTSKMHTVLNLFSGCRSIGVNFASIIRQFTASSDLRVLEPDTQKDGIRTTVLHRGVGPAACGVFRTTWDGGRDNALESANEAVTEHVNEHNYDRAMHLYGTLLEAMPSNWFLIHEVARLLCVGMNRNAESLIFAKAALRLNPYGAPMLWNTLGDILCSLGRCGEALTAFRRAVRIDGSNVTSRTRLAQTYTFLKDRSAALVQIAEGLSLCREAGARKTLLRIQEECLSEAERQDAAELARTRPAPRHFIAERHSRPLEGPRNDAGPVPSEAIPEVRVSVTGVAPSSHGQATRVNPCT